MPRLFLTLAIALSVLVPRLALAQGIPAVPFAEWLAEGVPGADRVSCVEVAEASTGRIYFGTTQGEIAVSEDDGATWQVFELQQDTVEVSSRPYRSIAARYRGILTRNSQLPDPSSTFNFRGAFSGTLNLDQLRNNLDSLNADRITRQTYDAGFGRLRAPSFPTLELSGIDSAWLGGATFAATSPIQVLAIESHPNDGTRALAATSHGLYETRNGGESWQLIFRSVDPQAVEVRHAIYKPSAPEHILAATSGGLYESFDDGRSFATVSDMVMSTRSTRWLHPDPDTQAYPMAIDGSVRRWRDSGHYFGRAGWSFQVLVRVRRALVHPTSTNVIVLTSGEGAWITGDGGENWAPISEPAIFGADIDDAYVSADGTLLVASNDLVWRSTNWRDFELVAVSPTGADARMVREADDGELLVAWEDGLQRISMRDVFELPPEEALAFVTWYETQPSLTTAVLVAQDHLDVSSDDAERLYRRSRTAGWAPQLSVGYARYELSASAALTGLSTSISGSSDEEAFENVLDIQRDGFAVFANWDLARTIFRRTQLRTIPAASRIRSQQETIREEVMRHYVAWIRLHAISFWASNPELDVRRDLVRAHLDFYTNGLFSETMP